MTADDFRPNEKSVVIEQDGLAAHRAGHRRRGTEVLKESVPVEAGEVVDATFMSAAALQAFLREQIERAKADDVLFSLHLKATMMKVSDPIIFGHAVQAFFPTLFAEHGDALLEAGLDPQQRPRRRSSPGAEKLGGERRRRSRPPSRRASPTAPSWRWSTPTRASPTCTSPATSSSTPHARDDPHLGPHVGSRRRARPTPSR